MDGDLELDLSWPVLLAPSSRNAFSEFFFFFCGGICNSLDLSYRKGNRQNSPYATNDRKQRQSQCTVKILCLLVNLDKATPSLFTTWLTKTKKKVMINLAQTGGPERIKLCQSKPVSIAEDCWLHRQLTNEIPVSM